MKRTMTSRARLSTFANVSRVQSEQETYDMAVSRDVELKRQRERAERAEAERDALRADAERWRWYRENQLQRSGGHLDQWADRNIASDALAKNK